MKVKFNLPKKSYNSKLSFDNNTTFGFGNVQPLFSKFVVPHSKLTINFIINRRRNNLFLNGKFGTIEIRLGGNFT